MQPETASRYGKYLIGNYTPPAIAMVRGSGSWITDDEGREYLDFTSGIAVNALGHAHPAWVAAVSEAAGTLAHCSNLFGIPDQGRLAEELSAYTPPGRFLFCNSGAEANEALLKLARLHGAATSGQEGLRFHVITAENAFHGRTFGGMAATPQEKIQGGFRPMLAGFQVARINDIDSFARAVTNQTAAIFLETIQGEGGVFAAEASFLQDLRQLCDERNLLLLIDEVQCGVGRTGDFFAYEFAGIRPDAIGMAKGLGGGFPIGAIWVSERHAGLFRPGSHGTTFGGNPLASAAALAVLRTIAEERLLERVREQAPAWHEALRQVARDFPDLVDGLRGRGYLVALATRGIPVEFTTAFREAGLLAAPAGNQAIRLLPPLTVNQDELQESVRRVRSGLARLAKRS